MATIMIHLHFEYECKPSSLREGHVSAATAMMRGTRSTYTYCGQSHSGEAFNHSCTASHNTRAHFSPLSQDVLGQHNHPVLVSSHLEPKVRLLASKVLDHLADVLPGRRGPVHPQVDTTL